MSQQLDDLKAKAVELDGKVDQVLVMLENAKPEDLSEVMNQLSTTVSKLNTVLPVV